MKKLITTFCLAMITTWGFSQGNCYYHEDMETIDSLNSVPAPSGAWIQNTRLHVSGIACDSAQVPNGGSVYLETNSMDLSNFFFVTLSFYHIARIDFFDKATVEYSIDGGITWSQLTCADFDQSLPDAAAFCGQSAAFSSATTLDWDPGVPGTVANNTMWHLARFDLSQLVGGASDVKVRFKLEDANGGGGGGYPGWFIDDVCIAADVCELDPPVITFAGGNPQGTVYSLGPYAIFANIADASGILVAQLTYTVNNGAPQTVPMNLVSGTLYSAPIPAVNDSDVVCYSISAVDNSGCFNVSNLPLTGCVSFTASQGITFPFCDNFDSQNLWTDSVGTAGSTPWGLGSPVAWPSAAHSAPNCWEMGLNQQYANNTQSYLTSPPFSFSGIFNPVVELWLNSKCENVWDGTRLEYTVNGSTWTTLGAVGDPNSVNWYNNNSLNSSQKPGWTGTSQLISGISGWFKASHKLAGLVPAIENAPFVQFRFVFTSDGSVVDDGFAIDDICLFVPPAQDAGVSAIVQPTVQAPAGSCLPVIVTIENFGSQPITTTDVTYTDGLGNIQTAVWTGNLAPGASTNFTITPCYTVPAGPFSLCAYTSLVADGLHFNDTTCMTGVGIPVLTLTSCDDFENGNIGWVAAPIGGGNEWQLGTPNFGATTGAHSGVNAFDINLNSGYVGGENDTLFSPIYDVTGLSNSNLVLSFWRNQSTVTGSDGLRMEYTINGNTWAPLGSVGDPNSANWYNQNNLNFSGNQAWDGNSNGWVKSSYFLNNILSAFSPSIIRFRFIFSSAAFTTGGAGVSIDDFCVTIPCSPDAGLTSAVSYNTFIGNTLAAGDLDSIRVTIHNYGTAAVTTLTIQYSINGTVINPPYTWNGNLAPNGNATIILPTTYTTPSSQYSIAAWTSLSGDCEANNDTATSNAVGVPTIVIDYNNPFCDDFEAGNIGWTSKIGTGGDPGSIWELGTPNYLNTSTTHSGVNAWDVNLNSPYTNNARAELYSPIFDLTNAVDTKIEFWQNVRSESVWDGTRLEYTTNNGATWTILGLACDNSGGTVNWYNDGALNSSQLPAWTEGTADCTLPTTWFKSIKKLPASLNNVPRVQFRYIFTSDGSVITSGYSIDDFCLSVPVPLTVTPVLVSTATTLPLIFPGQSIPFKARILNDGTTAVSSLVTTLRVDGNLISNDTITISPSIAPSATYNYIYANNWNASPGFHNVCVATYYPNASVDLKPIGDTICTIIQVFDSATIGAGALQKCYDFESGYRWVALNSSNYNSNVSWDLGSAIKLSGPHSPVNAWFTSLSAQYPNRDTSALFSPVFTVTGGLTYNLNFWHNFKTERNEDGGTVEYSTNLGQTWTQLGDQLDPNWMNTYSITALGPVPPVHPGWSGSSNGWIQSNHDLCIPISGPQQVIFRWRFNSDFSVRDEGWAIDDVCFEVKQPLATCTTGLTELNNEFNLVQNMPNPFSDVTTISFTLSDKGQTQLQIIDITGKVLSTPINASLSAGTYNVTVDAKNLASGVYFYVLQHNDSKVTRKMVVAK